MAVVRARAVTNTVVGGFAATRPSVFRRSRQSRSYSCVATQLEIAERIESTSPIAGETVNTIGRIRRLRRLNQRRQIAPRVRALSETADHPDLRSALLDQ